MIPSEPIPAEALSAANAKSARLRELLRAPEILVLPGAFNVLSALLFQHMGFPAIQCSSAGIANALGYADLGIGRDRSVAITREIASAVALPVNADGEEGFGGSDDVRETVRAYVAAGAAGMNMEDADRKAGLLPIEGQLEKIAAFLDARASLGSEFLLNARVDVYGYVHDDPATALKEAVRRGQAYAAAGADSVFFLRVADRDVIRTLVKEVPAPVSVFGLPNGPSVPELAELGVARVSFGSAFLYAAASGVRRLAEEVLGPGTLKTLEGGLTRAEMRAILEGRA